MTPESDDERCNDCLKPIIPCWCGGVTVPHWVDFANSHECTPAGAVRTTTHSPESFLAHQRRTEPQRITGDTG